MVHAESRVLSLQEEVSNLLLTIASGGDKNVSRKRNDARTRKGKKMLETRVEKRRSKAPSKTEYRDRTWRELQSIERQENYGGLLSTVCVIPTCEDTFLFAADASSV